MSTFDGAELRDVSAAVLAVTSRRSVREVLRTILTSARRLLDARYAALGVPDDNGSFAEFLADGISDEQWRAIGPLPRQHGLLGVMLRDPNPVRVADIRQHPGFRWWPAAHPTLTDFLGMPITDGDEILGELFLANKNTPGGFTERDEELLRLLAAHAAIALVNARLYERSRELSIMAERNRIARELHDAVTQKLFSLRLTADAVATLLERDPARAAAELDVVRGLAADAIGELRAIVVGLRPVDLAGDGLAVALRKQADLADRVHTAAVRFVGEPVAGLPPARQEAAYRIAQEALHNALRHGNPEHVTISLAAEDASVVLAVTDDGAGFDAEAAPNMVATRRLGLVSMRERATAAGGRLTITSERGAGTTVRLVVPADG
ncbi:MAG TPA: GAF domain-containing sensor histidine kinase [Pseudonocardiaceae bacterium]|nr:GAF domain-containing sensor histidine kinase [Pseudonocardiaceae bacterium]